MSGNKANKGGNNNFESYRQIAPETVDDQRIRDIIKNNGNDHDAILLAIENIWHDTPDQKAVGSEWVTTAKSNKKDVAPPKGSANSSSRRNESGAGRGSAGRGRSLPPSGGRGGGDSRGDRGPRSSSVKAPSRASPVVQNASEEADVESSVEVVEQVQVVAAPVAAVAPAALPSSSGATWGAGPSLAERLKRAEVDKLRAEQQDKETPAPAVAAAAPTVAAVTADAATDSQKRTRARRARGGSASGKDATGKRAEDDAAGDLADATEALVLESAVVAEVEVVAEVPPPPPLVQVSAPCTVEAALAVSSADIADIGVASSQGFLNMGKWEAPVEAAEMSAFQFGSFGNAYGEDDGVNGGVSASQVGTNPAAAPWTGLHTEEKVVSNVWGSGGDQSLDMSGGLFAQQNTAAKALETPDASVAATRAPPGLGQKANASNNNATRSTVGQIKNNKNEMNTAQNQTQQTQPPAYQQQQHVYNQGLPPGMNNRNAPALNPLAGGLPYPYNPSFDIAQQAQFSGYPLGGLVPSVAPAAAAATSAAPASTSSAASASSTATPTAGVAQPQQPYPAAPFPFYPNPYYPSQAYYYGQPQMPNYYGQGRDMYQQRGNPYGGNPYGNAGSLYPGDVYGQQAAGQFPDAAGNYGGHPGMQGTSNAGAAAGNNNNNNKAAKNNSNAAGAVGAAGAAPGMTPDQHTANLLMNSGYGYNPYNARGPMDAQGWQGYPGNQAGGWGAPMMAFPNNASPTNLGGSAQQQGQAQQQQQQQQQGGNRGNANNNNGYGNNSFGGRGNGSGSAPSAGGVSSQGNW